MVLSNNDGCIVTLTKEAKALGLKRGVPLFQVQDIIKRNRVAVFSSNYELYGDMSARMMQVIASLVPAVEVYSIDECFADLRGLNESDLTALGFQIRKRVWHWIGIPACVGIAPTKTLAKYCNNLAKKIPALKGVLNWEDLTAEDVAKLSYKNRIKNGSKSATAILNKVNTNRPKNKYNAVKTTTGGIKFDVF